MPSGYGGAAMNVIHLTEAAAANMTCPFVRGRPTSDIQNPDAFIGCIGRACMLWRTDIEYATEEEIAAMPFLIVQRPITLDALRMAARDARANGYSGKNFLVGLNDEEYVVFANAHQHLLVHISDYGAMARIPGEIAALGQFRFVFENASKADAAVAGTQSGHCGMVAS